jgi:hypothetical protein
MKTNNGTLSLSLWIELHSVRTADGELVLFGTDLAAAIAFAISIGEDVMSESIAA